MLAAVILAGELLAVTAAAARLSRWVCGPDGELLELAGVGLLLGLLQIIGIAQLAAALTVFSRWWVAGGQLLLAAAVLWRVPRRRGAPRPTGHARLDGPGGVVALLLAMVAVALTTVLALTRASRDYDTLQYHLPNAAHWVQTGSIWSLPTVVPPSFTNGYPSNGELLAAWLMLPGHAVGAALDESLPFAVLAAIGVALLAGRLGGRRWVAAFAAGAVLLAPIFFGSTVSVLTDTAGAAGVVFALAVLVRSAEGLRPGRRWVVVAGLSLGLSVGAKDTALGPALFVLLLLVVLHPGRRLRRAALLVSAAVVPSALWLIRDGVALDNPLFPLNLRVLGDTVLAGGVGPLTRYRASLAQDVLRGRAHPLHLWVDNVRRYLGVVALVALAGTVGAVVVGAVRRAPVLVALGCWTVAATALYLATPYTGPATSPILIAAQLRYDLTALLVGVALLVAVVPWPVGIVVALVALGWDLHRDRSAFDTTLTPSTGLWVAVVVTLAVALAVIAVHRRATRRQGGPHLHPLTLVLALGLAAVAVDAGLHGPPSAPDVVGAALPPGRDGPVAVVGVDDLAALLGPHLDHRLVGVGGGRDGSIPLPPAGIAAQVRAIDPVLLAVAPDAGTGYLPPPGRWRLSGREPVVYGDPVDIYVRRSAP